MARFFPMIGFDQQKKLFDICIFISAGKIAALETELSKERSQLVHERQLLEQERSQREAMVTELEKEMATKEALIAEMDKMRSEHGEALNNIR